MNYKKKRRRTDVVSFDVVEEIREKFGLTKKAFSELMGFKDPQQYYNCEKKGNFIAYRVYGAIDAIENAALKNALNAVVAIQKIKNKSGLEEDE